MCTAIQGLPFVARHVIKRMLNPRFLSHVSSDDVVNNMRWEGEGSRV